MRGRVRWKIAACIDFAALVAMAMAMTVTATPNNWFCVQHTETCTRTWIHIVCNIIYTRFGHDIQSFSFASNDDYYYFVDLLMDGFSENYTVHVACGDENIFQLRNRNHNDVPWKLNSMLSWFSRRLNIQNRYDNCCPKVQNFNACKCGLIFWLLKKQIVCNARCYMHTHLWVWHSIILIWINRNKFRFEWHLVYRLHNSNECHSKPIIVYLSIGESHLLKRLRNDLRDGKKRKFAHVFGTGVKSNEILTSNISPLNRFTSNEIFNATIDQSIDELYSCFRPIKISICKCSKPLALVPCIRSWWKYQLLELHVRRVDAYKNTSLCVVIAVCNAMNFKCKMYSIKTKYQFRGECQARICHPLTFWVVAHCTLHTMWIMKRFQSVHIFSTPANTWRTIFILANNTK